MVRFIGLLMVIVFMASSCDNDTIIGEDLLDEEEIGTNAKEDFDLKFVTTLGGGIYGKPLVSSDVAIGKMTDPIFGSYKSSLHVALSRPTNPDFFESVIDSAVLVLFYDTVSMMGNVDATQEVKVYEVLEDFADRDSIMSDEEIATGMTPLAIKSFVPNPTDSLTIIDRANPDTTISLGPQIRIPFNTAEGLMYASRLLADSTAVENDSSLLVNFKGLKIEAESGEESLLGISTTNAQLVFYYTKQDTLKNNFSFTVAPDQYLQVEHDYTQGSILPFFDNEELGDSIGFIQGLKGVDTRVILPSLEEFDGDIINNAELTLTVADLDREGIQLPLQLVADIVDGESRSIDDLLLGGSNIENSFSVFGGIPEEVESDLGETLTQYTFNITNYIQRVVKENLENEVITIYPHIRTSNARNVVILGPENSKYPAKLRITYTDL